MREPGDENLARRQQATTAASLSAFEQAMASGAVVVGTNAVYLGDRIQLKTATGGWAAVSNTGPVMTRVGTDGKVGPIWSNSPVDLRDRATVFGSAKAPSFQVGNSVVVQGGMSTGPRGPTTNLLDAFGDLPTRQTTAIIVESGQSRSLEPGKYGSITVRGQGTLTLEAAEYSFSTILVEQGGQVVTKSDCSPTRVQARVACTFRGIAVEAGGNDPGIGLVLWHEGTSTAFIEQPFRGVVIAPLAEINVSGHAHAGRFFGKVIRVQAGGTVTDVAAPTFAAGECATGLDFQPANQTVDIGPAPPLATPADLDTFLPWFYKITEGEKAAAEARIAAVPNNSGIREAVVARFQTARSARDLGPALMLLAFLGRLEDIGVRPFFLSLATEAITAVEEPNSESTTQFDEEVAYRRQALYILNAINAPDTVSAVRDVAVNSSVRQVRAAAIKALRRGKSPEAIESLRGDLRPEDSFYLDLPARSEPDFDAQMAAFRARYSFD